MNYWDSVGRWINTLLVFIVGVLAFDALFRLLDANDDNVLVGFVQQFAVIFLIPFQGMFGEQDFVLTTLIGVLGYSLLAGIALSVLRALQASAAHPAQPVETEATSVVDGHVPPPEALPSQTHPEVAPAPDTGPARDEATVGGPPVAADGRQPTPPTDGRAEGRPAGGERANGRVPRPPNPDGAGERRTPAGEPATSTDEPGAPDDEPAAPTTQGRARGGGPRERGRMRERSSSRRSAARRADARGRS